jgi:antitoxin PrlF
MKMAIAQSRITSQGQISVPAEIRKKLGVGPGSILDWDQEGEHIVVRRSGRHTSAEVHEALFAGVTPKAPADIKQGIRAHLRRKHARR